MKNIDESLSAFEKYKITYKSFINKDLSESDTRSKLIDTILIDVLGWDEKDIRREGHVDSGYFDYKLSVPGILFHVEAKKQFIEFKLPNYHQKASIKVLIKDNSEVINQIRNYGTDEGIPYGIITNGYQFIILKLFNYDGKPWKDNLCLVFNSIEDIESRFIEFYENLSKLSIISNGGFKFDLPLPALDGKTILSTLPDKEKELIRNSLSALLTPLIDTVFGEMFSEEREDDQDFIKFCFVENDETKKNKSEIERLFGDYAPEMENVIPTVNTTNLGNQILAEIDDKVISNSNSFPPKPIIIIGSKGAGKSTFINHLFKYKIENKELENNYIVYIDFRKFYQSELSLNPEIIAKEILETIYSKYEILELHSLKTLKRIYFREIKRNDESIWKYDKEKDEKTYNSKLSNFLEVSLKDNLTHFELLSKYLIRERRKRVIVIIDNADQFNDAIQEKIFIFSHSLSRSSLCGTVISLREGYYRRWQNSPPFDAYESNIYHVTAPRYIMILEKRIDFAIQKRSDANNKITIITTEGKSIELTEEYIKDFLVGLKNSLFSLENSALIDFMNFTTYPNIREGLRVFKVFLNSGHTKISEYIERQKQRTLHQSSQIIPIHEFIKSIALQNRHYYNSEISIVYNLFVPSIDSVDYFLKIYILKDLNEFIQNKNDNQKLIANTYIIEKLTNLGYKFNTVSFALFSLIKGSLIDTDENISDINWQELPAEYNMYITAKGHYYLNELIYRFHYYDLIFQDTPIYNPTEFDSLRYTFPTSNSEGNRNFEIRKDFIRDFFNYLNLFENKQPNQVKVVYGNITNEIIKRVNNEINRL